MSNLNIDGPVVSTQLGAGRYFIDGEPVTVQELCRRAHALKPEILRSNINPVQCNVKDGVGYIDVLPIHPENTYIDTREAAQVLRQHGHTVSDKPHE